MLADRPSEIICQKLSTEVAPWGNSKASPIMAMGMSLPSPWLLGPSASIVSQSA